MNQQSGWRTEDEDTGIAALARAVADDPNRVFLDFSGETYSYGEFDRLTNRLGHALAGLGVRPGDTVASMLDNHIDAVVAWFGINKIGGVSVPLNTALKGEFARHQIENSGAAILICEAEYLSRVVEISDRLATLKLVLCRGKLPVLPPCRIAFAALDDNRGADPSSIPDTSRPGGLACIIYTSGTTGASKGSMQSYNYFCNLARQRNRASPTSPDDITLTPMALFHNNALATGVTLTLLTQSRIAFVPRFSVSNFWPEIERSGATVISIVGSMGKMLADAPDSEAMARCFGRIHTVRGVPFPDPVKEVWRRRFGVRQVGSNDYGMTEAAVVTWLPGGAYAAPDSSGKRSPDFDLRIVDDEDHELQPNSPGEVIVRPLKPNIMFQGYWRRPDATAAATRNLWFHTGDLGKFDDEGFFYFVDRKKDYLRRRGENISSFEMEATLRQHPDILEVAVHAVASSVGEDDVKVTAVLKPGARVSEEALCLWAIERVPYYAVPRYVEFRDELPKNPQDKVLKFKLREEGKTTTTWDLEGSGVKLTKR